MSIEATRVRTLAALLRLLELGASPSYLYFWGPNPRVTGEVDESCLCNWYPASFRADGVSYRTTEHYLMAEKARLFGDLSAREQILAAETPLEAQMLGRWIANFDEDHWAERRVDIIIDGNLGKFRQNPELRAYLAATVPHILVQANPWDSVWGIGVDRNNARAPDAHLWKGLNLLGFALMEVRDRLLAEPG